jgi:hypothetical protein
MGEKCLTGLQFEPTRYRARYAFFLLLACTRVRVAFRPPAPASARLLQPPCSAADHPPVTCQIVAAAAVFTVNHRRRRSRVPSSPLRVRESPCRRLSCTASGLRRRPLARRRRPPSQITVVMAVVIADRRTLSSLSISRCIRLHACTSARLRFSPSAAVVRSPCYRRLYRRNTVKKLVVVVLDDIVVG